MRRLPRSSPEAGELLYSPFFRLQLGWKPLLMSF